MHQLSPRLLYGSEICTLRRKDEKRLASSEIKFFRKNSPYTIIDHKINLKKSVELKK